MASPVTLANVYTALCEYSVIADPSTKWRNTYDFHSAVAPTGTADVVAAIQAFALGMIFADQQLDSVKVYNWARGSQLYPAGLPILDIPVNAPGQASTAWVITGSPARVGNDVCLRVDKEHSGIGRPGRFFYRNLLTTGVIEANPGQPWTMAPGSSFTQGHLTTWITTSGLVNFLAGHVDPTTQQCLCTVQYSRKTNVVHGFNYDANLVLVGVTTNKPTRKSKK